MHSARTIARPGNSTRASSQASGTPNTIAATVAHSEHHSDRRSAVSALSEVRIDQTSPHGAFHSSPRNGRAKKAIADAGEDQGGNREPFPPHPAMADGDRRGGTPSARHDGGPNP